MAKWQLQDAKAKFSKVVDDAVAKGPKLSLSAVWTPPLSCPWLTGANHSERPRGPGKRCFLGTVRDSRFRFPSAGKASGAKRRCSIDSVSYRHECCVRNEEAQTARRRFGLAEEFGTRARIFSALPLARFKRR